MANKKYINRKKINDPNLTKKDESINFGDKSFEDFSRGDASIFNTFKWHTMKTAHGEMSADKAIELHGGKIEKPKSNILLKDSLVGSQAPANVINRINSLALDSIFLGWGELSLLQQNIIVNNLCDILSSTMTHEWITFISNGSNKNKLEELEDQVKKYDIKNLVCTALYKTFLMGTSYIYPKFKDDNEHTKEELLINSAIIEKDSLEYFTEIEPTWVVPVSFNMNEPRLKTFYNPQSYNVMGQNIHRSRLYQLKAINPVNLISPMYLFGGMPLAQLVLPAILDYQAAKKEVITLMTRMKATIITTNMNNLRGPTDAYGSTTTLAGNVKQRLNIYTKLLNNESVGLLGEGEEFKQFRFSMAELKDILQQQAEFISFVSRVPVAKLFGQSPSGMNSSGKYDDDNFHENISTMQEKILRPLLKYMFDIIQVSSFGEIDVDIDFVFNPLGEINKLELSSLKNDVVDRAIKLCTEIDPLSGKPLFSHEEIREFLLNDEDLSMEITKNDNI